MKKKKKAKKAVIKKPKKSSKKKLKKAVKKAPKKPAKKQAKKPVKKSIKKPVKKLTKKPAADTKILLVNKPKYKPGEYRTAYVAIGSNVGDREEYIEQAITLLKAAPGIKVVSRASNYETGAKGRVRQADFINSAAKISTNLTPTELLASLQGIEDTLGRERGVEWGPRTIDLDILLYADEVISEDDLQIPHPLMQDRLFVLEPLKEIAPHVQHPVLERTILELFEDKRSELNEKYDDELPGFKEIKRGTADDYERW